MLIWAAGATRLRFVRRTVGDGAPAASLDRFGTEARRTRHGGVSVVCSTSKYNARARVTRGVLRRDRASLLLYYVYCS